MAADNLAMAAFLAFLAAVPAAPPTEATGPPRKNNNEYAASASRSSASASASASAGSSSSSSSDPALNAPATVSTVGVSFAAALAVLEIGRIVSERLSLAGGALGVVGILAPLVAAFAAWRSRRTEEERWLYGRGASPAPFAGAGAVGGALMLTFFATLGACADPVAALTTGAPTFAFIAAQLATHFCVVAVVARRLMRLPAWAALTASNACVGGPATAAAMASARGWGGAVQPAIVAGTLGYVVGTPVGCVVGNWLKSHLTPLALPTLF
jgi:Na+/glutamate symporter